jgi:hypothetical protein
MHSSSFISFLNGKITRAKITQPFLLKDPFLDQVVSKLVDGWFVSLYDYQGHLKGENGI